MIEKGAMTDKDTKSHVVLAYDRNFWAPGYATARSVFLTAERPGDVTVHVLHTGLERDHIDLVRTLEIEHGGTVRFYDVTERVQSFLADGILPRIGGTPFTPIIYARVFMFEFLPGDIGRVVYLDTDTFVRSPIEWLLQTDLEGHALGAVTQPDRIRQLSGKDLREKSLLRMGQPYFNSGVLLIDAERYRSTDIKAEIERRVPASKRHQIYYDQDVINIAFLGRIKRLDTLWNLQNPLPAHEAFDPHILHYSASQKPWKLNPKVAFAATYRHLMTNEIFYRYWRERAVFRLKSMFRRR